MIYNCMSYALRTEKNQFERLPNLDWTKSPLDAITEICDQWNLKVRSIESSSEIFDNEWCIAFFGWVPCHLDYEGRTDKYDYHFVRKEKDGSWYERETWGAKPQLVDFEVLCSDYRKYQFEPQYFALKRAED